MFVSEFRSINEIEARTYVDSFGVYKPLIEVSAFMMPTDESTWRSFNQTSTLTDSVN